MTRIKRFRPQYSLRLLLVGVLLLSVPLAWFANAYSSAVSQRNSRAEVFRLGGIAWTEWDEKRWSLRFSGGPEPPAPSWLFDRLGPDFFYPVVSVKLTGSSITDDSLRVLDPFDRLEDLLLVNTCVSEKGVRDLKRRLPGCEIRCR